MVGVETRIEVGEHTHHVVLPEVLGPAAEALAFFVRWSAERRPEARDALIAGWVRGLWGDGGDVALSTEPREAAEGGNLSLATRVSRVQRAAKAGFTLRYLREEHPALRAGARAYTTTREEYREVVVRWSVVDRACHETHAFGLDEAAARREFRAARKQDDRHLSFARESVTLKLRAPHEAREEISRRLDRRS